MSPRCLKSPGVLSSREVFRYNFVPFLWDLDLTSRWYIMVPARPSIKIINTPCIGMDNIVEKYRLSCKKICQKQGFGTSIAFILQTNTTQKGHDVMCQDGHFTTLHPAGIHVVPSIWQKRTQITRLSLLSTFGSFCNHADKSRSPS